MYYIVKLIVLCCVQILTFRLPQSSAIVTSRSIRPTSPLNSNAYYDPATNHRQSSPPPDDWESGLREATYQAILRERNYERTLPQLREDIARAPLLNKAVQTTPFGDIAVLARGQLYGNARVGLTFVQDRCGSADCGAYLPRDGGIVVNSDLLAVWSVKRIRHRDNGLYRYEIEYTISPINPIIQEDFVTRNGRFNYEVPGHVFIVKSTQIDKQYKYDSGKYREYLPALYNEEKNIVPSSSTSSSVPPLSGTTLNHQERELYQQLIDTLHKKTTHRFGSTPQSQGTTSESIEPIRESLPLPTLPTIKEEIHTTLSASAVPPTISTVSTTFTTKSQFRPSTGVPTKPTTRPTAKVTYMFDGTITRPRSTSFTSRTTPMKMYFTNAVVLPTTKEIVRPTEVYQSTFGTTKPFEQPKPTFSTIYDSTVQHLENTGPITSTFGSTLEDIKPIKFDSILFEDVRTTYRPTITDVYSSTYQDTSPATYGIPPSTHEVSTNTHEVPTTCGVPVCTYVVPTSIGGYHYSTPVHRPSFTDFIRPTIQTTFGSPKPHLTSTENEGTPFYVTPETTQGGSTFKGQGPYSTTITLQPVNPTIATEEVRTAQNTESTQLLLTTNNDRYFPPTNTPHFITISSKTTEAITGYPFVNKVPPFFDEEIEVFPENKLEKPSTTTEVIENVSTTTLGPFLVDENYNRPNKIDIADGYNIFGEEALDKQEEITENVVPQPTIDTKEIDEVFGTLANIVKKNETEEDFKDFFGPQTSTESQEQESTTTSSVRIIYEDFFEASTTTIAPTEELENITVTKEATTIGQNERFTTLNIEPTKSTKADDELTQTSQSISTSITFEVNLRDNQTIFEGNQGSTTKKDFNSNGETLQAIESQSKGTTRKINQKKRVKVFRKKKISSKEPNLLRLRKQEEASTTQKSFTDVETTEVSRKKYNETNSENTSTFSSFPISTNEVLDNLALTLVNNAKGINYLQDVTTIRPIQKLKYRRKLYSKTARRPVKTEE